MENKPLVSVIMGIYNCENTLKESINSIISQTYENWELIMCDDCSTDRTYEIAKRYEERYEAKIVLIRNSKNLGLAGSLNKCIKHAQGEYIARQDGDDISLNTRFEEQVSFLSERKYDLVGTSMIAFNEKGDIGVRGILPQIPNKNKLALGPPFCHATIMMRAKVYRDLNGYRVTKYTKRCEDIDLWFRFFAKDYKGTNINKPLYKVRDDESAYQRRNFKSYIYATKVCFDGYRLIKAPLKSYIYLGKPLIAAITPKKLKEFYYKKSKN